MNKSKLLVNGIAAVIGIVGILYIFVVFFMMYNYGFSQFFSAYDSSCLDKAIYYITGVMLLTVYVQHSILKMGMKIENKNYEDFLNRLSRECSYSGYEEKEPIVMKSQDIMRFYVRKERKSLDLLITVHLHEINSSNAVDINNCFLEFITQYYRNEWSSGRIERSFVICVDRATPQLYSFVNTNIRQRLRIHYLPVGINFEDGSVIITRPKNYLLNYLKLKRKFMKFIV